MRGFPARRARWRPRPPSPGLRRPRCWSCAAARRNRSRHGSLRACFLAFVAPHGVWVRNVAMRFVATLLDTHNYSKRAAVQQRIPDLQHPNDTETHTIHQNTRSRHQLKHATVNITPVPLHRSHRSPSPLVVTRPRSPPASPRGGRRLGTANTRTREYRTRQVEDVRGEGVERRGLHCRGEATGQWWPPCEVCT